MAKYGKLALECRKKLGLTQEELAQELGCTKQYVSSVETQRTQSPTFSYFWRLHRLFPKLDKEKEIFSVLDSCL